MRSIESQVRAVARPGMTVTQSKPIRLYATARRPMMANRSLLEIQSMAATATKIIRIRNDTFCHSSTRIYSASCRPMPPAPTMPMMVAERVFDSMK
jgi:hypothetical protein